MTNLRECRCVPSIDVHEDQVGFRPEWPQPSVLELLPPFEELGESVLVFHPGLPIRLSHAVSARQNADEPWVTQRLNRIKTYMDLELKLANREVTALVRMEEGS